MRLIALISASLILVGASYASISTEQRSHRNCSIGQIRGFAHVRGDPRIGIGSLPPLLTDKQSQFAIRYNCTHRAVQARRIDRGIYEVRFPRNPGRVAVVSAVNSQGASASVYYNGNSSFVVTIRGPLIENNVLEYRELPFYIIVV